MIKNVKGITLITLVITIIILIILAGITITSLTGDNGLFARAKEAQEKTLEAQIREEVKMMLAEYPIDNIEKKLL